MRGNEEWTFAPDGPIVQSLGDYEEVEYLRRIPDGVQLAPGTPIPGTSRRM
ncbi:MAG: hypothetical protein ABI679_16670 [Gemmatimonadota bacterium]